MADKITISEYEIHSAEVDDKLRQQAAMRTDEDPGGDETGSDLSQLLYHTVVYTTLFGFAGGILIGVVAEIFFFMFATPLDRYEAFQVRVYTLDQEYEETDMTDSEYDREYERIKDDYQPNRFIELEENGEMFGEELETLTRRYRLKMFAHIMIWFCTVGITLAVFLSIADPVMSQNNRSVLVNGSIAAAIGMIGAFFGCFIAGFAYSSLGGGEGELVLVFQIGARAIAWGLIGGFLALAPGIVIKNVKRSLIGLIGGLLGGALGGMLFDPIALITGSVELSRIVAIIAIGTLIGFGSGLLEMAAKTAWVRVVAGLIAGKQFIFYKNTTYIGSSPQCEIYLFKDPTISPRHAAIHKRGNRFELEDLGSATTTILNGAPVRRAHLKKGDRIRIGSTELVFMERKS